MSQRLTPAAIEFLHEIETAPFRSALDRLILAGLLFQQGAPPHASYLFKHALVQDAAYGTLLREPRRALHARIAETLESQFAEIAESRPELLARHCTEAGLIEKAAGLWGKAGQRSLERSALVEAAEQLTRALEQIATLPATPALRREADQASGRAYNPAHPRQRLCGAGNEGGCGASTSLIERAEALGEPPEDPLLLFSVLYGFWVANYRGVRWRRHARPCGAVHGTRREARGDSPTDGRASSHGNFFTAVRATSRKAGRILITRSHFTILPSIVRLRPVLGKTSGWRSSPIGRWRCGCLAIPRPRSETQNGRSRMRARSAKPPR